MRNTSCRRACFVATLVVCVTLSSCASSSTPGDKPVIIENPTAKSRLALQNAVCKSLGVAYVVLADDALTHESTLIVEPARIRDFEGNRLQGRETRMPQ